MIVVQTDHFSVWSWLSWDWLLDGAKGLAASLFSGDYVGSQPACQRETEARDGGVTITSDDGERIRWCLGLDDADAHRLKVTNGRPYAVSVSYPATMTVAGTDLKHDVTRWAGNWLVDHVEYQGPGRAQVVLGAGDTVELSAPPGGAYDVVAQPSPGAYLVTAFAYAADTLLMLAGWAKSLGWAGEFEPAGVLKAFDTGSCLVQAVEFADTSVTTPEEALQLFLDLTDLGFGCMIDTWKQIAGFDGLIGSALLSVFSWLITGVKTVIAGFEAAADTLIDPDGYTIDL